MNTSLEFSKKLVEVGFCPIRKTTNVPWANGMMAIVKAKEGELDGIVKWDMEDKNMSDAYGEWYPMYDILNDLCVKYANEVWGYQDTFKENEIDEHGNISRQTLTFTNSLWILNLVQQGKQDEAEKYIEENSILFNKDK